MGMEMLLQHRLRVMVMVSMIAQEEEAGIQSTQERFKFMDAASAYKETERVKVNCTLEDTLQQASISGTQFDNAPVYDSDGSTEGEYNNMIPSECTPVLPRLRLYAMIAQPTGQPTGQSAGPHTGHTGPISLPGQATPLPHAFNVVTLHDPVSGAWNMDTEDILEHEAITLSDEEVTLDEAFSEARSSGGEEIYDMTLSESD
nr:hypothetical protein [Tanacetum cinerariifolium]